MNPLFAREFRARWRDRRAWLLLLALVVVLALLANAIYRDSAGQVQSANSMQSALAGRALFMALSLGNVVAWLFIASILSATGIARERERGLLESLQLSPMAPRSQIVARVGASLAFLLILQLTISPVYATIFWLGGVSPEELGLAASVIASTAAGGTVFGLWLSARARRPLSALYGALGFCVLWLFALLPATVGVFASMQFSGWWVGPANAIFWTHPLALTVLLTNSSDWLTLSPPLGLDLAQMVWLFCACYSVVGALLLWGATRAVARVLPMRHEELARTITSQTPSQSAVQNAARSASQNAGETVRARPVRAGKVALPVARFARFSNPILTREVRERLRFARVGLAATLFRVVLLILGASIWVWMVYTLIWPPEFGLGGGVSPGILVYALWVGGALTVGAMASASFARERESATWEALKLSLLAPAEIVRAKWLSPLIAFAILSAPLWMVFPLGLRWGERDGMEPGVLLMSLAIIALSLSAISMVSLVVSWRARHPHAALGWMLSLGLIVFIALPIAPDTVDFDRRLSAFVFRLPKAASPNSLATEQFARAARFQRIVALWHPMTALQFVQESGRRKLGRWLQSRRARTRHCGCSSSFLSASSAAAVGG